jgi:hypothetical protein
MKLYEIVLTPEKSVVDAFYKILLENKSKILFHLRKMRDDKETMQTKLKVIADLLNEKTAQLDIKFVPIEKKRGTISIAGGVGSDNIITLYLTNEELDQMGNNLYDIFIKTYIETIRHELIHVAQNNQIFKANKDPDIVWKYKKALLDYMGDKHELMAYAAGLVDFLKSKGASNEEIANFESSKYLQGSIFLATFKAAAKEHYDMRNRFLKYVYGYLQK